MSQPVRRSAYDALCTSCIRFLSLQLTAVTRGHHPRACRLAFSFLLAVVEFRFERIAFRPRLSFLITFLAPVHCHFRREHELSSSSSLATSTRSTSAADTSRAPCSTRHPGTRPATSEVSRIACCLACFRKFFSLVSAKSLCLCALQRYAYCDALRDRRQWISRRG